MAQRYFITGATGFVGGHVAEACRARGHAVSTIARANSDTDLLDGLGVTVHRGDLTDADLVRKAVESVDVIVHCAAKVADWGPIEDFRPVNVEALRQLLEACKGRPLHRFVHMSTLGVYAVRHHYGTDESEPLPAKHIDGYTQTKVEADLLAQQSYREHRVPVVVLRPGFVYGPRDRTVLPRIIEGLRNREFRYVGTGRKALNAIYVGNLVEAVFLATENPQAVGQVYNLTDGEPISKRRLIEAIVRELGLPGPVFPPVPKPIGRLIVWWMEWRARRTNQPPKVSRAGFKFLALNLDFSIDKARRELGYQPKVGFDQAIKETMAWYRENA